MDDLRDLPGVGSGLAAELRAVGVRDVPALRELGAPEAARRLAELGIRDAARAQQTLAAALAAAGHPVLPPEPVLGIEAVVLTVGDIDAALEHYGTGLGLPIVSRDGDPPTALLSLGDGGPGLLLREDRARPDAAAATGAPRIRLAVADPATAAASLRSAGVAVGAGPTGEVEVADRWGSVVELVRPAERP